MKRAFALFSAVVLSVGCGTSTSSEYSLDVGADEGGVITPIRGDASGAQALDAHIEQNQLAVTFLTLSCAGDCATVEAVGTGGTPPYTYAWEDGSTSATRQVCPLSSTSYRVSVTDTGTSGELARAPQTAQASLDAHVTACPDGGGNPDGGVAPDAGPALEPAGEFHWTHWTRMSAGSPGSVAGVLLPPSGAITVTYSGEVYVAPLPGLPGTQTTTGANYFAPASTYTCSTVGTAPILPGVVMQQGGTTLVESLTFSRPVTNPVLAIMSLGDYQTNAQSRFEFGAYGESFTILQQGPGAMAGPGTLADVDGGLQGDDGDGLVQLDGTFTTIRWTDPIGEFPGQHGLTVGIAGP
ncbi:MAG: hypothetical protein ACRENE_23615 [Polyangiaceae bacterium]